MKKSLISLQRNIKEKAQQYYEGNPTISDSEFDELVDTLKKEDPNNEILKEVGWGYDVNKSGGNKHPHHFGIVGSLDKIHSISELNQRYYGKWLIIPEKLDGASCVAYYKDGNLVMALSRGNGEVGIDVTDKFLKITSKYDLSEIKNQMFTGAIRGEIVMSNESWEQYKGLHEDAKSPRNVATGLMMKNEVSEDLQYIDFVTYKIHGYVGYKGVIFYETILDKLKEFGFPVCWYFEGFADSIDDDRMKEEFLTKPNKYPCDGFVIYPNDGISVQEDGSVIYTNIAYKFKAHQKETKVVDIEWNLSPNNILVPVVVVEPVELSGAVVTRASGFNYENIIKNKIGKGSIISLNRSGEVIPCIQEVIKTSEDFNIPDICPVCGSTLVADGVNLVCKNTSCPNVEYSRLYKWVEVVGVRGILGVGPTIINDIIHYFEQIFNIKYVWDVYKIIKSGTVNIDFSYMFTPVTSEKVKKILKNLTTPIEFYKVLIALNIQGLGDVNSKKLSSIIYNNISNFSQLKSELDKVKGIGDYVFNILKFNSNIILRVMEDTVSIITPSSDYYKYQVTVTGSVSVPRDTFKKVLENNNILLSDNIKTSKYLITNNPDSGSSKLQKALKLGIPILTEKEFFEIEGINL